MKTNVFLLGILLAVAGAAQAESPVVLRVRKAVAGIEARSKTLRKTTTKKEIAGGEGELLRWTDSKGALLRAVVRYFGEHGSIEIHLYWQGESLLFAYVRRLADEGASGKTLHATEHRFYYDKGKVALFRSGEGSGPIEKGDKITVVSKDVSLKDPLFTETHTRLQQDIQTARSGKLPD